MVSFALLLLCFVSAPISAFRVDLLITHGVHGLAFPVNKYNKQCTLAYLAEKPCKCYGGADRRATLMATTRQQLTSAGGGVVALDMGGYFYGGGLLFPTFKGGASAQLFAQSRYDAYTFSYRDFPKDGASGDGKAFMADYVAKVRKISKDTFGVAAPPVTITNMNVTGDPSLGGETLARHTIVPLPGGRRMAVLSLFHPSYLSASNPDLAARVVMFEQALQAEIALLHASPGRLPEVVVCILGGEGLQTKSAARASGVPTLDWVHSFVNKAIGVDVVIATEAVEIGPSHIHKNWAGHDVLVVGLDKSTFYGVGIVQATIQLDEQGHLLAQGSQVATLKADCNIVSDASTFEQLKKYDAQIASELGVVKGYLPNNLYRRSFDGKYGGNCTVFKKRLLPIPGVKTNACGCDVAGCGAGRLISDALRWYVWRIVL
jgi:hypothetical protein